MADELTLPQVEPAPPRCITGAGYDLVVVGAGAAGMAAAVRGARTGLRTLLLESAPAPGGVFAEGAGTTVCGLYRQGDEEAVSYAHGGLAREFAERLRTADAVKAPLRIGLVHVLPCRPGSFTRVALDLIAPEQLLTPLFSARVTGIEVQDRRVKSVSVLTHGAEWHCAAQAVVDCSGQAAVCRMAGETLLAANPGTLSPAVVQVLEGVTAETDPAVAFLEALACIVNAVRQGRLPAAAERLHFMPTSDSGTVVLKLNLGAKPFDADATEAVMAAIVALLATNVRAFRQVHRAGPCSSLLHRANPRLSGRYILTGQDVLDGRDFADAIACCPWPIETWDGEGRQQLTLAADNKACGIPRRCLQGRLCVNLFAAGRAISADDRAIASARVVGTCLATGEAAADMAAALVAGRRPSTP